LEKLIKTEKEIQIMRAGGAHLARILRTLADSVRPGLNLLSLDAKAEDMIAEIGGTPSFKGYNGFPASICVSVNDEVVHGIPRDYVVKDGDVVAIDVGLYYQGYHTDTAATVISGTPTKGAQELLAVTQRALEEGIAAVKPGMTTGDLGAIIGAYITEHKMGIVKELVGHGVGRELQEDPMVPNFGSPGEGTVLKEGMTIAIEPMVTLGKGHVVLADDEFTYKTADGSLAAHFEDTVLIKKDGTEVLTKE
jgi:methionyl aminopeptidase